MDDTFYAISVFVIVSLLIIAVVSIILDAKTHKSYLKNIKNILTVTSLLLVLTSVFLGFTHCEYQSRQYLEAIITPPSS